MQTLIDLGERRILQTIIPRIVAGAGDDCASIELPMGQLVATTDPVPPPAAASIGKDDDPFWMGWLLVTINASDLAARLGSRSGRQNTVDPAVSAGAWSRSVPSRSRRSVRRDRNNRPGHPISLIRYVNNSCAEGVIEIFFLKITQLESSFGGHHPLFGCAMMPRVIVAVISELVNFLSCLPERRIWMTALEKTEVIPGNEICVQLDSFTGRLGSTNLLILA